MSVTTIRITVMKKIDLLTATAFVAFLGVGTAFAANPMVGGAAMSDTKNIVQNAMNSKDHTTLVTAGESVGIIERLRSQTGCRISVCSFSVEVMN